MIILFCIFISHGSFLLVLVVDLFGGNFSFITLRI